MVYLEWVGELNRCYASNCDIDCTCSPMFRRCISLVVVAGILASHLATIPHAHAGMSAVEQKRHDATPHFHSHGPGHSHHGHRHSRKPSYSHSRHASAHVASNSSLSPFAGGSHDNSAVFVPVSAPSADQKGMSTAAIVGAGSIPAPGKLLATFQAKLASAPWHPPDEVLDSSKIYLTLRTLRN
jgi:hypothetical protein